MISRRIPCLPENDNYRRLARYIADASHDCEKALMSGAPDAGLMMTTNSPSKRSNWFKP
jgi:hypothetical protein